MNLRAIYVWSSYHKGGYQRCEWRQVCPQSWIAVHLRLEPELHWHVHLEYALLFELYAVLISSLSRADCPARF